MLAHVDLGGLAEQTSEPVFFWWNPLYSLAGAFVWMILGLALCLRPNRTRQAWLVLIPVFVVLFVWSRVKVILGIGSSARSLLDPSIQACVVAIAVAGLSANWLNNLRWYLRIPAVIGLFASMFVLSNSPYGDTRVSHAQHIIYWLLVVILLAAVVSLRKILKDRRAIVRVIPYLCISIVIWSIAIVASFLLIWAWVHGTHVPPEAVRLAIYLFAGSALMIGIPFALLMTLNSYWQRQLKCLVGSSMSTTIVT